MLVVYYTWVPVGDLAGDFGVGFGGLGGPWWLGAIQKGGELRPPAPILVQTSKSVAILACKVQGTFRCTGVCTMPALEGRSINNRNRYLHRCYRRALREEHRKARIPPPPRSLNWYMAEAGLSDESSEGSPEDSQ